MRVVLDVAVFVSYSSVVTEFCDVLSLRSDRAKIRGTSVLFFVPKKRTLCFTSTQQEIRDQGSRVKTPPITRRRMTPPTPLQNPYTSFEKEQGS